MFGKLLDGGCTGPAAGQRERQRESALAAPLWRPAGQSAMESSTVGFTGPPTAALPGLSLPDTAQLPGAPWQLASCNLLLHRAFHHEVM